MYTQEQIAGMQKDPQAVAEALNALFDEVRMLLGLLESLTGESFNIAFPERIEVSGPLAVEIEYDPVTGFSLPRADGAVRHILWDKALDAAQASDSAVDRAWASSRQRWVFCQDVLKLYPLTINQRDAVTLNCSGARFQHGLGSEGRYFRAGAAFPITRDEYGPRLGQDAIQDAFSLASDLTRPNGEVLWEGFRGYRDDGSSEFPKFADASLKHFRKTSGGAFVK